MKFQLEEISTNFSSFENTKKINYWFNLSIPIQWRKDESNDYSIKINLRDGNRPPDWNLFSNIFFI